MYAGGEDTEGVEDGPDSADMEETASVAEWIRAWDTLAMFEATVCGRS